MFTPKGPTIPPSGNFQSMSAVLLQAQKIIPPQTTTYTTGVTPSGLAITPDGKYAYISNNNNYGIAGSDSITVINLITGISSIITDSTFNQPYTITIFENIAYVTNSNSPLTNITPGQVTKIDITTNLVVGTLGTLVPASGGLDGPSGLVIVGRNAYINNYGAPGGLMSGNGHTVSVMNIDTGTLVTTIEMGAVPAAAPAAVAAYGNRLYVANYVDGATGNGNIKVVNTDTDLVISTITGLSGPFYIAINPNGLKAYVSNFGSNFFAPYGTSMSIIDTTTNLITKTIQLGIQPSGVAVTPDGKFVFVSNYNTLYAWVITSPPAAYPNFSLPQYLNLTAGAGTVNVIDAVNEVLLSPTILVGQSPNSLAITPDGMYLLVTNYTSNTCTKIYIPGI